MRFEHPHLLWTLLVVVPAMLAFLWWAAREKRRVLESFISARLLPGLLVGGSPGRRKARMILLIASVALLILALARPQIGFSWEEARSRGLDIVVAIDTSRSMLAADVAPNRLRRAQLSALDLKRLARADRLGLVAFAGGAFLQCPLTLDDAVFRQSVEALDVNIIPQGGTALAEAIDAAKGAFKEGNDNHKVLVLFTDGEDHDGNAVEAAKAAAKDGMRIFAVGVGTANGELLRTMDVSGRSEFIKDSEGNAVKSRLDEKLLREVAQETGGFYLPLSGANTMNLLYERGLAPLPKSDLASQRIKRHHERFQWLLGIAIVLLLIEMLLPERKASKVAPASAVESVAPAVVAKAVAIIVMLVVPSLALAGPGGALKRYQGGDYGRALEEYERSLKSKPDDPRLHFNAGAAAFQNKDYDQALNHLNSALITEDVAMQQRAYYNLGNTKFRQGEGASEPEKKQQFWEQAIKSFDSALTLDPKDADSEFNKEFVKKKLEELKQQQQQQNKDDKSDKDDQKDQKDQSKQDQQSKDQQSKDQQKPDQKDQQKDQQQQKQDKEKQGQDQQKKDEQQGKQDEASKQNQEKEDGKKPGQAQQQNQQGEQQEGDDGQPQPARSIRMTPQQAAQLLEAIKGEEKLMTFKPVLKSNRTDRVIKDW